MAKQAFVEHNFRADSQKMIELINSILAEYARQGYRLSLRQLYYQLVARDYIENSVRSYKRTGDLVSKARLAGLLDWEMIEDRNRETIKNTHWDSPAQIVRAAARGFRIDRWEGQETYVEVMVEKDALSGILLPVCRELDVRFTANKGYSSSSAMYEAGQRFWRVARDPDSRVAEYVLIYLGDHDPSGIDMTRDVDDRLVMFSNGLLIDVVRIALNMDQIEQWRPPENPAKETDSRFEAYQGRFGDSSWELDAVEPRTLAQLLRDTITPYIDQAQWDQVASREAAMRTELERFADDYENREE
jgi:hypothetical protein